jgi:ATP-dependent Lon protease
MRDPDWIFDEDDERFGEVLHRRTEELYDIPDAIPDEDGIIECPIVPLRDMVVFPKMVSPLFIGREISLAAIEAAHEVNQTVVGLTQIDPDMDEPGANDFLQVGVELAVGRMLTIPDGTRSTLVQGRKRLEILEIIQAPDYLYCRARAIVEPHIIDERAQALMRTVVDMLERAVQLNHNLPDEAHLFALNIEEPGWLADMVITSLSTPMPKRQEMLVQLNPLIRLDEVSSILAAELDVLELEEEIQSRVQNEVDRGQREIYLREQMRAIQSELGERDMWAQELAEMRGRVDSTEMSEEAQGRAAKELDRLAQLPPMSPETGVIRTYVEWLLDLPWQASTDDNLDLGHAASVLERYHFGLPRAKERILEYIAVRSLKPVRSRQPILCFVGPPGTGKTSLGRSIAEALGRKFVRLSLGGVRDEAEIRGHRRTYIGSLPGRILQTMKRAEVTNPLFMLDEVDKLAHDYRGDPSSALLEVLDPEQNFAFSDHYLELPYDLSQVMFITTANWPGRIPEPLLDRMELINFSGYIDDEKVEIAKRFLIPKQIEENGLAEGEIQFSEQALHRIVNEYTYEAGVRNLDREVGRVCRKVARMKAEQRRYPTRIQGSTIEKLLGPPHYFRTEAERKDEVGIATALAWTENGGDIMPIEVLLLEGKGNLQITGQIGEVMQESAQAALSYLKSKAKTYKLKPDDFESVDIHLHIPEGSVSKDGPSAGITIAVALTSAFSEQKTRKHIGMTGEITLRGRVLPVGGIRDKVVAAHRAGLKTVLLPKLNLKDLIDLPKRVKNDLELIGVEHVDEVLAAALIKPGAKAKSAPKKPTPAKGTAGSAASPPGA